MSRHWIAVLCTVLAAVTLAGCGSGSVPSLSQNPVTPSIAAPHGEAFGGQQPVVGMSLQLYAPGSTGYGSAATAVFSAPIMTNSDGDFSFPPGWTCPAGNPEVYLVGTGGDPVAGDTGGSANPNLALMVALGLCGNLNASTHIHMNELTTVAAVWALAPFMSGSTQSYLNLGTSSTNNAGLQLAFEAANEVANISNGTFPGALPAGATLPTTMLNTLADVLEGCINSTGGTAGQGNSCGQLFEDAPSGSAHPTDTITAALNIAQNPARNVTALFDLVSATPAFEPNLSVAPSAWTVAIEYTGGGLSAPTAIAADQSGNIWAANGGSNSVSEFDNAGNAKSGPSGITVGNINTPKGVAIDLSGNAWITNSGNNTITGLNSAGGLVGTPLSGNGLNQPTGIAIDANGNIWATNAASGANSVSAFTSAGGTLDGSAFTGAGIASPAGIAINGSADANCADCY